MNLRTATLLLAIGGLIIGSWLLNRSPDAAPEPSALVVTQHIQSLSSSSALPRIALPSDAPSPTDSLLAALQDELGWDQAREREAILGFNDDESYQRFLNRVAGSGLELLDRVDGLRMARVRYDRLDSLARDLAAHPDDYQSIGANPIVYAPTPPSPESRAALNQVPFGDSMLQFLGIESDHRAWGSGVTIAVLDSGVAADPTFDRGRLRHLDIGMGRLGASDHDGHGTAVAALAAGAGPETTGVAPSASILSIRVTDADGVSDAFTLSRAIVAAVEAGADVINISMGAYSSTQALDAALSVAQEHGVAVVASAGNDQAAQLTWPAADPRVISVGSVDALEQQVRFSNSGRGLQLSAPGYGIHTAWVDGERISFSGTSASAPIVAGALAAVMSQSPGLDASEAWQVIARHASDSGAPGTDSSYGHGILNLGWTMARNDPNRADTAIGGHHYDPATGLIEITVQNRGAQAVAGLELLVQSNGGTQRQLLPWLGSGAIAVVRVPADNAALASGTGQVVRSQLVNPEGLLDQNPSNNLKASTLLPAAP